MRRREKFVIASVLLSLGLLGVQYTPLDWRYGAISLFSLLTYLISTWALADDLQAHERLTIVPFPALYAAAVSLFYFLLPTHVVSQFMILLLFGVGLYALFLTANIYSVAKGRTIQLVHAAHAIGLLFTLLTSLLFANTIFSARLPLYSTAGLIGLSHFPLIFMSLWSVRLDETIQKEIIGLSGLLTLLLLELTLILSLFPFSVWYQALFIMTFSYIGLGIFHNYLRGRLFTRTLTEYSLVALFITLIFFIAFPYK
jgi:hypothetical protein